MTTHKSRSVAGVSRLALLASAMALAMTGANSQPATPMQMPAEIVKPMPGTSTVANPGADMKQGMGTGMAAGMGAGMDMKPMMTDMNNKMMGMKSSGNFDVDFAMMMRIHHQSAIAMGEAQLQNGKDPQMRAIAKNIIRDQKKEIAFFDKFLAKRGEAGMKMGN